MAHFQDKVAVITGAARGIGQCIADRLSRDGCDVALCDLSKEWLHETEAIVQKNGRRSICYEMNVSEFSDVQNVSSAIAKDFGRVDILVNNAGITQDGLLARMSEEDWDRVIAVNLKGTFLMTKLVSKMMMKQRSGTIVNIASIIGLIGNAGQCNYAASKAGVIALTKSVAKELAPRNVRANAVAPGFIQTKMTEKLPAEVQKKMLDAIPLARFGKPEDIADVVAFLASDEASYVSGQVLSVCGAMVT